VENSFYARFFFFEEICFVSKYFQEKYLETDLFIFEMFSRKKPGDSGENKT